MPAGQNGAQGEEAVGGRHVHGRPGEICNLTPGQVRVCDPVLFLIRLAGFTLFAMGCGRICGMFDKGGQVKLFLAVDFHNDRVHGAAKRREEREREGERVSENVCLPSDIL